MALTDEQKRKLGQNLPKVAQGIQPFVDSITQPRGPGGRASLPDKYLNPPTTNPLSLGRSGLEANRRQRTAGSGANQGAAAGAQTTDRSGTGVAQNVGKASLGTGGAAGFLSRMNMAGGVPVTGDADAQSVTLPMTGDYTEAPRPSTPRALADPVNPDTVGARAQAVISQTQALREQYNNLPASNPARQGATLPDGSPLPSRQGTFNTGLNGYAKAGSSLDERLQQARLGAIARGESLTGRSNTRSGGDNFLTQKRLSDEQKRRQDFYDSILSKAGRGPKGEISLANALDVIAKMEGQRLGQETSFRGQDIDAETADLNRNSQAEMAANRERTAQLIADLEAQQGGLDRESRERIAQANLTSEEQRANATLQLGQERLRYERGQDRVNRMEARQKAEQAASKNASELLVDLINASKVKNQLGEEIYDPESVLKMFELFSGSFNKE